MKSEHVVNRDKLLGYSAFLSILVVLIHTENIYAFSLSPDGSGFERAIYAFERFISGNIAKIGVPSFFMLSGILFYRDFDFTKYPQKMKSRFFSLMIPYLLWNFLRFAFFYLLGKFPAVQKVLYINPIVFTPDNLFKAVFFYKYNMGYWFMYQLIIFTLLCPIIHVLLKKKAVAIVSLCAVFVLFCSNVLAELSVTTFRGKFIQTDCLFYYMLGGFIGTHCFHAINTKNRWTKLFAIFGVLVGQACFSLFHTTQMLVFHILFCTISSVSFWYLFDIVFQKPLTKKITTITFFIYSAHGTVLELSQAVISAVFPHTPVVALCEYLLLPCMTLALLVGVSMLLKRYANGAWKLLNGGR